jgi:hypothetical protein
MLTDEMQILLVVLRAVADAPENNPDAVEVLNRNLGAGWLREFVSARSLPERLRIVQRRRSESQAHLDLSQAEGLCYMALFLDSGYE